MRAMRSLKYSIDRYGSISGTIAGKELTTLLNYPSRAEETITLRNLKYQITNSGVVVVGERQHHAPWDDIVSHYKHMDCYFIGFDKRVKLLEKFSVDTRPLPVGHVFVDAVSYHYPAKISGDTISECIPPTFSDKESELKRFINENTSYPIAAFEVGFEGKSHIRFTVNPDNQIADVEIIRGYDPSLDREVKRVVKSTNNLWKAGTINGMETPVEVAVNVIFKMLK